MLTKGHELNEIAHWRMEVRIKNEYPLGPYVAIAGGEIVGDSSDFMTLHNS